MPVAARRYVLQVASFRKEISLTDHDRTAGGDMGPYIFQCICPECVAADPGRASLSSGGPKGPAGGGAR